jgi:hypothetical protein
MSADNLLLFEPAEQEMVDLASGWEMTDSGLAAPRTLYGKISEISGEFAFGDNCALFGLTLNYSFSGAYQLRIDTRIDGIAFLYLTEYVGFPRQLASVRLDEREFDPRKGWFSLCLTLSGGKLTGCLDGEELLSCFVGDTPAFDRGLPGVRIVMGRPIFRNLRIFGEKLDPTEPRRQEKPRPVSFSENFSLLPLEEAPSRWLRRPRGRWRLKTLDGQNAYSLPATEQVDETWLHVFERDPEVSLKFRVDEINENAKFGVLLRWVPETAYLKAGYDFSHGGWFLEESRCDSDLPVNMRFLRAKPPETGVQHTLRVFANDETVKLRLDGKFAFKCENLSQTGFGRVGMFAVGCAFSAFEFSCELPSGSVPTENTVEYPVSEKIWAASMQIVPLPDGELLGLMTRGGDWLREPGIWLSKNRGKSFEPLPEDNAYAFAEPSGYQSVLKLKNGQYLICKDSDWLTFISDDMRCFEPRGRLFEDAELTDEKGRPLRISHVNAMTEIDLPGGGSRVFLCVGCRLTSPTGSTGHYSTIHFSDNCGKTWQRSKNDTRSLLPQFDPERPWESTWTETKVVQCKDGTLRLYYPRNKLGCMHYSMSRDLGETWEGFHSIENMPCPTSSFSVCRDPGNRGVWYMVWVNDRPKELGNGMPRTRLTLAKSDDGKSWEFLADVERMSCVYCDTNNTRSPLFQIVDPSVFADDGYIYVTTGRSAHSQEDSKYPGARFHKAQRVWFTRFQKSALSLRPWDASTVTQAE